MTARRRAPANRAVSPPSRSGAGSRTRSSALALPGPADRVMPSAASVETASDDQTADSGTRSPVTNTSPPAPSVPVKGTVASRMRTDAVSA